MYQFAVGLDREDPATRLRVGRLSGDLACLGGLDEELCFQRSNDRTMDRLRFSREETGCRKDGSAAQAGVSTILRKGPGQWRLTSC